MLIKNQQQFLYRQFYPFCSYIKDTICNFSLTYFTIYITICLAIRIYIHMKCIEIYTVQKCASVYEVTTHVSTFIFSRNRRPGLSFHYAALYCKSLEASVFQSARMRATYTLFPHIDFMSIQ